MAETIREMVVRLSMDAGGFNKTANDIKGQIRNIDKEIKTVGGSSDAAVKLLNEKLATQKLGIENLQGAITTAKSNFDNATTAADKLLAAKRLSNLETQLNTATSEAQKLEDRLKTIKMMEFGSMATNFGRTMKRMGRSMSLYVTAPLAALGGKAYKTALDYETATVSMKKTIDETDATKYEDIEAAFKEISESAPVAYTELMELAGKAGALGVKADDVVQFVEAIAMLSVTADDLDSQTGAIALANFLNVTDKGSFKNVDNVSSTITELGNNMNTTEGQIAAMAQRMAATGTLAGLSQAQILGLAASFSSLGIESQAGGSAASKLMKKMQVATEVGGKAYKEFGENAITAGMSVRDIQLAADDSDWVTGMAENMGKTKAEVKGMVDSIVTLNQFSDSMGISMAQFGENWKADPAQSMLDFFKGLDDLEKSGGEESVLARLDAMGLTEIRLSNLIAGAASNPELFIAAMDMAEAYEQNTATFDEAQKRYATAQSQQDVMMNKMENTAADAGENIVELMQPVIKTVTDLVGEFSKLDDATQTNWVKVAGALIILGPAAGFLGTVATGVGALVTSLAGMTMASMGAAISTFGAIAGAGVALTALAEIVKNYKNPVEFDAKDLTPIQEQLDGIVATTEEISPALQKAIDKKTEYDAFMAAINSPEYAGGDWREKAKTVAPFTEGGYEQKFIEALNGGSLGSLVKTIQSDMELQLGEAMYEAGLQIPEELDLGIKNGRTGLLDEVKDLGTDIGDGIIDPITDTIPGALGAMQNLGEQLQREAGKQAALIAAAWNTGLGFGGGGLSGGVSSGKTNNSYNASSNFSAGTVVINNAGDAKTLAKIMADENHRQLTGLGRRG